MPTPRTPGVYVNESPSIPSPIAGVDTATAGFIGPARSGSTALQPDVLSSLADFEQRFGSGDALVFSDAGPTDNYLWHAARAFFAEGGSRLFVSRVFRANSPTDSGVAFSQIPLPGNALSLVARFPGESGNVRVRFVFALGANRLGKRNGVLKLTGLSAHDVVLIRRKPTAGDTSIDPRNGFYGTSLTKRGGPGKFYRTGDGSTEQPDDWSFAELEQTTVYHVYVVTVLVTIESPERGAPSLSFDQLSLDVRHRRANTADSLLDCFASELRTAETTHACPIAIIAPNPSPNGLQLLEAFFDASLAASPTVPLGSALSDPKSHESSRTFSLTLTGGNDGQRPLATDYVGQIDAPSSVRTGLKQFEAMPDIAIVAAPGSTAAYNQGFASNADAITDALIAHVQALRYRFAVLDSGDNLSVTQIQAQRTRLDSAFAGFYYPWVTTLDPRSGGKLNLPPSGFVTGIFARSDREQGVWKAPANEAITSATGVELALNHDAQTLLSPAGINCIVAFPDRGLRVWGARTTSSDADWKYVNVRRYFAYVERSLDLGTQWTVFEPNAPVLWTKVVTLVENFLQGEWRSGALAGTKPEQAFFAKCDRTTMTQDDIDNGRLVCEIGIAPVRPAEFVIFRIGQWTSDHKPRPLLVQRRRSFPR